MADITMCCGLAGLDICPIREKCYRYTAIATLGYQSWFAVAPFKVDKDEKVECASYWDRVV